MRKLKSNGKYIVVLMLVFLLAFGTAITAFGADRIGPITEWDNDPSIAELEQWLADNNYDEPCEDMQKSKYNWGEPSQLDGGNGGTFTDGAFSVNVTFSNEKEEQDEYLSVSFSNASKPVYFFVVKYGGGADTYYYPSGIYADGPLTVPGQQAISHISFYHCEPTPTRDICVIKYEGAEGNVLGEGWDIYLYDYALEPDEELNETNAVDMKTTGSDGKVCFTGLSVTKTYYVYEDLESGWNQLEPSTGFFTVDPGTTDVNLVFRNELPDDPTYSICGFKYNEDTEAKMNGWSITLEKGVMGENGWEADESFTPQTVVTGEGDLPTGKYCFDGLLEGTYRVTEQVKSGWTQVSPDPEVGGGAHIVELPGGESYPVEGTPVYYDFYNEPPDEPKGSISGTKHEWINDQKQEPLTETWTIMLFSAQQTDGLTKEENSDFVAETTTGSDGSYFFGNLDPGTYWVYEIQKTGWEHCPGTPEFHEVTIPYEPIVAFAVANGGNDNGEELVWDIADVDFCNKKDEDPTFSISGFKYRNATGASGIVNWNIYLYDGPRGEEGTNLVDSTSTASDGSFRFDELDEGTYYLYEENRSGWTQLYPTSGHYEIEVPQYEVEELVYDMTGYIFRNRTDDRPPNGGDTFGTIYFNKVIRGTGVTAADNTRNFTVNVQGPDGFDRNVTFNVNNGGSLHNLEPGTYTFEEINVPEGFEPVSINPTSVTINRQTGPLTAWVTVTNAKDEEEENGGNGELIVPPTPPFVPPVIEEEPEQEITVTPVVPELPRTGGFETLLMGMGGLLAGAGAYIKIRNRKRII